MGLYRGPIVGHIKVDTRSLDFSSCAKQCLQVLLALAANVGL